VVGIAYKPNVSDDRESASVDVANRLAERGASVSVYDPYVGSERIAEHGFETAELGDLSGFDLAAVLTDHAGAPYERLARDIPLVFDARGIYRRLGLEASNVEAL
jgi:UDP-N-acetyl-D-glucosamine dehydrogenase